MVGFTTAHKKRLRSRQPFVSATRKLLSELSKQSSQAAQWIDRNEIELSLTEKLTAYIVFYCKICHLVIANKPLKNPRN